MNQRGSEANDLDCGRAMDDRKPFFVRADEKLATLMELEAAVERFSASSFL